MKVVIETKINAPADKVWQVLAHQFAEIDQWASIVETSRPMHLNEVPASMQVASEAPIPGRVTKTPLGEFREVFVKFSDAQRAFTFQGADQPFFVSYAHNASRVTELGPDTSKLTFEVRMDPKGIFKLLKPLLRRRFMSTYGRVQQDLKQYVEQS